MVTILSDRDRLDAQVRIETDLLLTYAELAAVRELRARRLLAYHRRPRTTGVYDLMQATAALQAAHDAWSLAAAAGRRLGKLLAARRGDGVAALEDRILYALERDRETLESADDTVPGVR